MKFIYKRAFIMLLTVILVLSMPVFSAAKESAAEEQPNAKDLTSYLKIDAKNHGKMSSIVLNTNLKDSESFFPYERFYAYWDKKKVSPGYLCIQWNKLPEDLQLQQLDSDGVILSQRVIPQEYDTIEKLLPETQKVAFLPGREGMDIARLILYSDGILPEPFVNWQPTPDHLDYLVISTHPDDDTLFMGGVIPIYGVERGYVGTVAYVTSPNRTRINEAKLGAWTMGAVYAPIFLDFCDVSNVEKYRKAYEYRFLPEAVTLELVRMFREYHPLVVFSQGIDGEYGHWQHKVVSACVIEAAKLAADDSYDPVSLAQYGTWQVQKCYIHLYTENTLVMDVNTPLASMGGKNALDVAREAFSKHRSQQTGRHWVQSDTDRHPMSHFGMAYGVVEAGSDVFDNIDPHLFYSALKVESESIEGQD